MQNNLNILYVFFFIVSLAFAGCQRNKDAPSLKPAELYHLSRYYPDYNVSSKVFLEELKELSRIELKIKKTGNQPEWITQGPYNHGGRLNTIAHNPGNDQIIYVGGSNGGIFKTTDGGENWLPIFDEHAYLAIGHIFISPHDTNTVFVGTGDPNISGYPWVGNGIYKSNDAGESWKHLGLENVGIISKIAVHPDDEKIIYAATMGIPFERNEHRGLYKSTDGGSSWQKILFLGNDAGIIDLLMLPNTPDTLYAAGWNRIRNYNESVAVGLKSKIYKSVNGGNTWDTLLNGLPQKEMSRIGLTLVENDSISVVAQYVNAQYETEGIYYSNIYSNNWSQLETKGLSKSALGSFGWYFGKIRTNPFKPNQLFVLGVELWESNDFGKSFSMNQGNLNNGRVHADKHDMVFIDSNTFLLATDGGLYKSVDGGNNWEDIENIANTQFYRVAVDNHNSGNYCGGAQDNGTIYGNYNDSVAWTRIIGGDGFQALFDWDDSNLLYAETQNGFIYVGTRSNNGIDWRNFIDGIDEENRPWDMPICMSKINSKVLFTGARSIFKNSDAPNTKWQKISSDLTEGTNPFFHFVSTIDVSPFSDDVVMAGTSNGKVQVLYEGIWSDVSTNLPERYVSDVFASYDNEQAIFVGHTGYKANEYIPHIHYSDDLGANWIDISGNLPQISVNSIFALPNYNDSVVFAATDGGVYHTLNRGEQWERTGLNMPIVPVYDLAYDDTNYVLVAATFGRSIMAIDLSDIAAKRDGLPVVGLSDIRLEMKVYPNPATNFISVELNNSQLTEIEIFNSKGQLVLFEKNISSNERIDVSRLAPGLYLIQDVKNQISEKILISR